MKVKTSSLVPKLFHSFCLLAVQPTLATVIEDESVENDHSKSVEISQSSQLTNDQNETQPLISSTTGDRPTTPARISYRRNPDGSLVSISRPVLTGSHQSPIRSLRRVSSSFLISLLILISS